MPAKNGSKPATQVQLKAVRADLKTVEKSLRTNIQTVEKSLRTEIQTVEKSLRTDSQSVKLELKGDIQKLASRMIAGEVRLDKKIDSLDVKMGRGFDRITGTIDAFLGRLEAYSRESVTLPKTLDAHGEKLRDHEKRLTAVESR